MGEATADDLKSLVRQYKPYNILLQEATQKHNGTRFDKVFNRLKARKLVERVERTSSDSWFSSSKNDAWLPADEKSEGKPEFVYRPTPWGKQTVYRLAQRSAVWGPQTLKPRYKLVAFDLDDTLISGGTQPKVDTKLMATLLTILKQNGVKTAIFSVNGRDVIYERLKVYGLLPLIDYPFFDDKGRKLRELIERLELPQKDVLFVGQDVDLDYHMVRDHLKAVNIILLKDALTFGDIPANDTHVAIVDRSLDVLVRRLFVM